MNNAVTQIACALWDAIQCSPVCWGAFDDILDGVPDINIHDEYNETILSKLIYCYDSSLSGSILPDIMRHFLAHGYDVRANDGRNGCLALSALCYSSYDRYVLDAAKILMRAGAPVKCQMTDEDDEEDSDGVIGTIDWTISGAWAVDHDYEWANILEAYYAMAQTCLIQKNYTDIDSYHVCLNKPLTAVFANKSKQSDNTDSLYTDPLVLWFGDIPLVVGCYIDFVVNPLYVEENKTQLTDMTSRFSSLLGATLKQIQYIGQTLCFLEFDNGIRLFFASRPIGNRKRVGLFDIQEPSEPIEPRDLSIRSLCAISGRRFADRVTVYSEDALALFCDTGAYLLQAEVPNERRRQLVFHPCPSRLLDEYTREYPIPQAPPISCLYQDNDLYAIRLDCNGEYLHIIAANYLEMEIALSTDPHTPLECCDSFGNFGRHVDFKERNTEQ